MTGLTLTHFFKKELLNVAMAMHSKIEEYYAWSSRVKFIHIFFVALDSVVLKSSRRGTTSPRETGGKNPRERFAGLVSRNPAQ
jgi:hypothetical protein